MGVLADKIIVITGGSRGFGLAVAQACSAEGAAVVVAARSEQSVAAAVAGLRAGGATADGLACDVRSLEQVEALADHASRLHGRFDVWVNNAGYAAPYGPAMHVTPAAFKQAIDTNITGTYHGSLVALAAFLPAARGKLINILGRGSDGRTSPMQTAYAASKAWVRSFTASLAEDYKQTGVGIYAINPGMMTTDFVTDLQAVSGYEKRLDVMPTILRMWARPPEVPAQKVVWLASSATDGKTGLILSEMGPVMMAGGALREGWRRLLRRPADDLPITVRVLPATLPLPNRRGPGSGEKW